jgi:hypothetical protein
MILSEIRIRNNPYENDTFFLFLSAKSLLSLLKNDFVLYNKDKSSIAFSLEYDIPQNNHNWELLYPIRISLNAKTLYEKYPSIISHNNKISFLGKRMDLLKHITEIDVIADIKSHIPMDRLDSEYIKLVKYLFNKIKNRYSFLIQYVNEWSEPINI